jgi:hypothetical protein
MGYRLGKPARDQYTTPPKNYVQLLQHIHHAYNLDKLYNLMRVYRNKFDSIHVAAAMSQVPKLYRPIQPGARLPKAVAKARVRQPAVMLDELQVSFRATEAAAAAVASGCSEGKGAGC